MYGYTLIIDYSSYKGNSVKILSYDNILPKKKNITLANRSRQK